METRFAKVGRSVSLETLAAYLPSNYNVVLSTHDTFYIAGRDNAGWTLDDYIIPRLASGLIWAEEITSIP